MFYLRCRAVLIVSQCIDYNSDARWTIGFVHHLFEIAGVFGSALRDGALDVVFRHILGFGARNSGRETWGGHNTARFLRLHSDKTGIAGEDTTPSGVGYAFLPLNLRPLTV